MSFYRIADLILEIDSNGIRLQKELELFQVEGKENTPDIKIELDRSGNNLNYLQTSVFAGKQVLCNQFMTMYEDTLNYYVTFFNSSIIYGYSCSKNERKSVVYCADVDFNIFDTYNVEIGAETPLIFNGPEMLVDAIRDSFLFHASFFGRLAIHSASIIYKDRVWLFSAMSGVGKSTHVKMWEKAGFNFEHFNGDLALIYKKDNLIIAAGMPWCGTSKIYTGNEMQLGGNISLMRGEEDAAKKINGVDAVLEMLARCISPVWDKNLMNNAIDILEAIVPQIVSGVLWCTPTVNAAVVSKRFIDGEINENI